MRKIILAVSILASFISFSQTGSLVGKILDNNDKNPLIGVNLILEYKISSSNDISVAKLTPEQSGTATDLDGDFAFRNLEDGEYKLTISYIGYEQKTLDIIILNKEQVSRRIYLEEAATKMDNIVISAGKFEQKLEEVTVSMDIIKPNLIESKNSTDLEVLMNQSPGVQVVDGQANIRGGSGWSYNTGSRVLVMVDDMPILSGDRGTVEWNMIPMENISQIEVIKGASSVLFGSSAMNGVINVRTEYPKDKPEAKVSFFSGYYDTPPREGLHWWGDNTRRFQGLSFSYAEYKNNTGLVIGANVYANDGYKGGYIIDPNGDGTINHEDSIASNFGEELPVSEKWGRFNFSTEHKSKNFPGLSYGINGNFMYLSQYQSLIFAHDEIGYTPINVPEGSTPTHFTQMMFNIDPHVKYITSSKKNPKNQIRHTYKSRLFRDDYQPLDEERGFSNVFYQEYQFQKTFNKDDGHIVSTSGLTSNYIKGDYDEIYGEGGISRTKQMFNYSMYSQFDWKYKRLNLSFGARLEHFLFQEESLLVPVLRTGLNYKLFKGTFLRSSFGQGYRYPTIMESFVKTSFHPVYVYPNPDLKPEHGWSSEIGLKQLFKIGEWKGVLDLAGFIMHYNDMIEFTFGQWALPALNPIDNFYGIGFKCVNIGETQINGGEISLMGEGKIGDVNVSILGSYTRANPIILNPDSTYYEYINAVGETAEITYNNASHDTVGNILKYRHEHLLKFDVNLEFNRFNSGLSLRYNSLMRNMDRIFGSGLFNDGGGTDGTPTVLDISILKSRERMLNGDFIIDWRVGVQVNQNVTLSLIIDNVLNREYQNRPADLGAPRTITLKLSAKM